MIEALKKDSYLQVRLYSKGMLQQELEERAVGVYGFHGGFGRFLSPGELG
jgi:hypothetical protein